MPYKLDGHKVLKRLTRGAQGVVFLCEDPQQKQQCAIKVIQVDSPEQINEVLKETTILLSLDHPNIVPLKKVFVDSDEMLGEAFCEVMPFYEHGDLAKVIQQNVSNAFSEKVVVSIFEQLVSALQYIHSKNIVHRDIKPENILVKSIDLPNDQIHVVLGDFGLSKMIEVTASHSMIGSVNFMAPELVNRKAYNNKVDVFSLGCVMFAVMARRSKNFIMEMKTSQHEEIVRDLGAYKSSIASLVADMLTFDPATRPKIDVIAKGLEKLKNPTEEQVPQEAVAVMSENMQHMMQQTTKAAFSDDDYDDAPSPIASSPSKKEKPLSESKYSKSERAPSKAMQKKKAAMSFSTVEIKYGNTHELKYNEAKQQVNHNWKFFVRTNADSLVKKVTFLLHPTFSPDKVEVFKPPFEIERMGWGEFVIKAVIEFHSKTGIKPAEVNHKLDFESTGSPLQTMNHKYLTNG